jgi:hypothetical protein
MRHPPHHGKQVAQLFSLTGETHRMSPIVKNEGALEMLVADL